MEINNSINEIIQENNEQNLTTPKKFKDMNREEKNLYYKEKNRNYRARHREEINAKSLKLYYDTVRNDPVKMKRISEQKKEHYIKNREKKNEYSKKYMRELLVCKKKLREMEFLIMS